MWSSVVLDPALPRRSTIAAVSSVPIWPLVDERGHRGCGFQVGAACLLSECAITIVASRSTGVRAPSGARSGISGQKVISMS
jgi:hypothetical protein